MDARSPMYVSTSCRSATGRTYTPRKPVSTSIARAFTHPSVTPSNVPMASYSGQSNNCLPRRNRALSVFVVISSLSAFLMLPALPLLTWKNIALSSNRLIPYLPFRHF